MIYLTTGGNGSFKTCNTLWDVRQQQLKENRPVFYHGFEAGQAIRDFGWKPFDPRKWQDLPDASICLMDECQNEFPLRKSGSEVPEYVSALAQFRRKRGFDIWMITPHPMLLDVFVRRLIDNPSWHRHNKRVAGANMISQSKWNTVKTDCEKPGAGDSGEVTMVAARKEVFDWYNSASLHTGKKKMPRAVWVFAACALIVPALGYFAVQMIMKPAPSLSAKEATKQAKVGPVLNAPATFAGGRAGPGASVNVADYLAARSPRIEGLPQTAPAYDALTTPANFPYPAACVERKAVGKAVPDCNCFTQQGTRLATPYDLCRQIVQHGFFMEWAQAARGESPLQGTMPATAPPGAPAPARPAASAPSGPMHIGPIAAESESTSDGATHDGRTLAAMRNSPHRFAQAPFLTSR